MWRDRVKRLIVTAIGVLAMGTFLFADPAANHPNIPPAALAAHAAKHPHGGTPPAGGPPSGSHPHPGGPHAGGAPQKGGGFHPGGHHNAPPSGNKGDHPASGSSDN
jgi:hypothetical protein